MTGVTKKRLQALAFGVTFVGCLAIGQAQATEGYFSHGYGARNYSLGGAGVADSRDAMALAVNPAGLAKVKRQLQGSVTAFSPRREYSTTGPGFVASSAESDREFFPIPTVAYNHPLSEDSAIGIAMFGNGGMNTTYPNVANPACGGGSGIFCGGKAGVDLIQAFVAVGYAHKFGALSLGVSPIFAVQRFKARGLSFFAPFSSDPANLSGRGYDFSVGGGVRVGAEWEVMEDLRLGASFQTKMYMSKFDKYAGLFEGGGAFDIPANVTAGVAYDITPNFTAMFDYKRIFYSDVDAVGNSSRIPLPFGSSGGPGFGWHDINIFKFGAEWRMDDAWTFRAGYAFNDNPIKSSDVTLNILAPGVTQHHITGGLAYKFNERHTVELAGMFAPNTRVSGIEVSPVGPNPARTIEIEMHQLAVSVGWNYNFGGGL